MRTEVGDCQPAKQIKYRISGYEFSDKNLSSRRAIAGYAARKP